MVPLIRGLFFIARLFAPYLAKGVALALVLMLAAVISLWKGMLEESRRIADEFTERAIQTGRVPSQYDQFLYWLLRVATGLAIFGGWLLLAHLTVFLVSVFF